MWQEILTFLCLLIMLWNSFQKFVVASLLTILNNPPPVETRIWKLVVKALDIAKRHHGRLAPRQKILKIFYIVFQSL